MAFACPAAAEAPPLKIATDVSRSGTVDVYVQGAPGERVRVGERVGNRIALVERAVLDQQGHGVFRDAERWRCDRLSRFFEVTGLPSGEPPRTVTSFPVRTPGCGNRLALTARRSPAPGSVLRIRLSDSWRTGATAGRLCLRSPRGRTTCSTLAIPAGRASATRRIRLGAKGRWALTARAPGQHLRRAVYVGRPAPRAPAADRPRLLVTGDSLMAGVDAFIGDRLGSRVETAMRTLPGQGISKPGFDWEAAAKDQMRSVRPRVSAVFLGANEGYPMRTPGGAVIRCCEEPWIAEFERRTARVMRAYSRGGRRVLWLTAPASSDSDKNITLAAVNQAVTRAARANRRVTLLLIDQVLSPGFRFREVMDLDGKPVRVRDDDGIHLSIEGSEYVAGIVVDQLGPVP